ncbi:MAG: gliding motility protein GldL [Prevotellaceae bacterium]|nr:gliding motility protein GldL [Prevotellaceae bacterium]
MSNYSKYNFVYKMQRWMDSVAGQTFLNYAYSWGASIVILGTLFKLTHLPLADVMLFLGMGTEVFVFFISAFDRPFDKTAEGQELMTSSAIKLAKQNEGEEVIEEVEAAGVASAAVGGPQIIVAGGGGTPSGDITINGGTGGTVNVEGNMPAPTPEQLAELANPLWLQQQQEKTPEMEEAQKDYVDVLKKLTEMLNKVCEQSERLTTDSQEMENLNRTLTAICKIYEMQLKSTSSQVATIDQINEQTRKMASQIEQLNTIYTRMIEAMTVNMKVAAPGVNLDK